MFVASILYFKKYLEAPDWGRCNAVFLSVMLYSILSEIMQLCFLETSAVNALIYKNFSKMTDSNFDSISQPSLEKSYLCLPGLVTHWFLLSVTHTFNRASLSNDYSYIKPLKSQSKQ